MAYDIFMRERRLSTSDDPVTEFSNLNEFEASTTIPSGRIAIGFKGIPVDFLFEDRGYTTTVIAFHGAVMTTVNLPYHIGSGVLADVPANRISISDPSLTLGGELKLGWFAGSEDQLGLQEFLGAVVAKIADTSNTENLVFFGASGGGFSALELSRRFPSSLAVAINPQTSISKYWKPAVDLYVEVAWRGKNPFVPNSTQLVHDLVETYPEYPNNTIAYIQNRRDTPHVKNHYRPFVDKIKDSGRVWELIGSWGNVGTTGHTPPPKDITAMILNQVASSNGKWDIGLNQAGFVKAT